MGNPCSKFSLTNNMGISGNNNLALMFNGVNYNISSILDQTINQIVNGYRYDLVRVHFASIFLTLMLMLVMIRSLIPNHHAERSEIK